MVSTFKSVLFLFLLQVSMPSWAQFDEGAQSREDNEVEQLYDKFDEDEGKKQAAPIQRGRVSPESINTLSELATLEPFNDIAVIQRRFLPKTGRFEMAGLAMGSVNNPFFSNLGLGLRGSYFLTEKHGIELQYYFLSNSERSATKSLRENINVETKSLTTPKTYMGAAYKWNPIYGKMTWLNQTIVPFDLFFTAGGGLTKTDLGNQEPTLHIGTGQVFAITKAMAFRWDISWNFYQAEAEEGGRKVTNNQDDLFLMLGMSFYFPEAKYR